jgi:acetaldehyde dehydrogenase (acetylating)
MALRKKDELVEEAEGAGVPDAEDLTKAELEQRIDALAPAALGPVIPEGEFTAPAPEASGSATTGVQPVEDADIPDAGR